MEIDIRKLGPLELESIIPLRQSKAKKREPKSGYNAEKITNLSAETIKRRYPKYVRQLSERREE